MKRILTILLAVSSQLMSNPDIVWTAPVAISNPDVDASAPRGAIDLLGNMTGIWVEGDVIKSSSLPLGGSWSTISTLSGVGASNPKICVDAEGNVIALWIENTVVMSASLPFGGSWGLATSISNAGASQARLAIDSSGNAVAIWTRNGYIESSTFLAGGSWGLVNMLSNGGTESNPDVAISANGTIIAVWNTVISQINNIYSAKGSIGGSWQTPVSMLAASPGLHHNYPRVAIDPNGNATAVWFKYALTGSIYSSAEVLSASLIVGASSWTAIPTILSSSVSQINPVYLFARVAVDNNGNAIALWSTTSEGGIFNIDTAVKPFGANWIVAGGLLGSTYSFSGDVAVSTLGDSLISLLNWDGSDLSILNLETDISNPSHNVFSTGQTISLGSDNAYPHISLSLTGTTLNGITLWTNYDGVNNRINASTGTRTVVLPPSDLSVIQNVNNFGVFSEYYNTISWTASPDLDVVQYNIYRNGIFVTFVDASTLTFDDHNAIQNGSVTYSVGASNDTASQSPLISISFP